VDIVMDMDENEMTDYWPDSYEHEENNDTLPCNNVRTNELLTLTITL
jgi:hypothetical protein